MLAGRAIAHAFAATCVLQWAAESEAEGADEQARAAVEFLKADIDRVRVEFGLLDRIGIDG